MRFDSGPKKVFFMSEREKLRRTAPLRLIESYWQALRSAAEPIPARSRVDPRGIEDALEYAFIVEILAPGTGRLRVAGGHLNDLMGHTAAGLPLSALFDQDARERMSAALGEIGTRPALLRAELISDAVLGFGRVTGDMVLLPLRSQSGATDRLLGGLVTVGRIGRNARRFSLSGLTLEEIPLRAPLIETAALPERKRAYGSARNRDAAAPVSERPHLKLVVSND
ncbi:PAS domain-containing protein [Litorisediminicola beolgyonensis]|uniref:PAS domain-containing protein n=1 Tax=Litorisediminicola beolgyonensis TaxID=1173614 RepID=A0ABW3ZNB0_9RHOB